MGVGKAFLSTMKALKTNNMKENGITICYTCIPSIKIHWVHHLVVSLQLRASDIGWTESFASEWIRVDDQYQFVCMMLPICLQLVML